MSDEINSPSHYTSHPSGVECIDIAEQMSFRRGNAVKYIWRAGLKGSAITDLRKARWYVARDENAATDMGPDSDVDPNLLDEVCAQFPDARYGVLVTAVALGAHRTALAMLDALIREMEPANA